MNITQRRNYFQICKEEFFFTRKISSSSPFCLASLMAFQAVSPLAPQLRNTCTRGDSGGYNPSRYLLASSLLLGSVGSTVGSVLPLALTPAV